MKKLALVLALILGLTGVVMADFGDSFTITCTPTGERGVIIATTTVDFTNISVGASKTTDAIPVLSTGTVANIEYTLSASISGGANLATTVTPAATEILAEAHFSTTTATFSGTGKDILTTSARDAGAIGADSANDYYVNAGEGYIDNMPLLALKNLWCRVTLPSTVSYSGLQTITVTVTAEIAD
jgi:hypothetical protein